MERTNTRVRHCDIKGLQTCDCICIASTMGPMPSIPKAWLQSSDLENDTKNFRFFIRLGRCVKELRRPNQTTQDVHSTIHKGMVWLMHNDRSCRRVLRWDRDGRRKNPPRRTWYKFYGTALLAGKFLGHMKIVALGPLAHLVRDFIIAALSFSGGGHGLLNIISSVERWGPPRMGRLL